MARETSAKERARLQMKFNESCRLLRKGTYASLKKETAKEQQARIERLLKPQNYGYFCEYYFGGDYKGAWATSPAASFHKKGALWLRENKDIKLGNFATRGLAKSLTANVGWPLFLMFGDIMQFMVLIGANQDKADKLLKDIQRELRSNEKIIKDFGQQYQYGDWSDGNFLTKDGSRFSALGIGMDPEGLREGANRVHYANADDCESLRKAHNQVVINKDYDMLERGLLPAFDKDIVRMVYSNNIRVKNGLIYKIIKENKMPVKGIYEGKAGKKVKVLYVPAIDEKGNYAWPERYSEEDWLATKERFSTEVWLSEFQHKPTVKAKLFKSEWIRHKKPKNLSEYDMLVGFWDMAYTGNNDFISYVLIGLHKIELHVLQMYVKQVDFSEAMDWHFEKEKERLKEGIWVSNYYDGAVNQEAVFEPLWGNAAKANNCFTIPESDKGTQENKYLRIKATLGQLFNKNKLFFSKELEGTLDYETGIEHLLLFEKGSGAPDDFPDALTSAARKLISNVFQDGGYDESPLIVPRTRSSF